MNRRMTQKAKALSKGSTIGIVAPSSSFSREKFDAGVSILESMGFKVSCPPEIFGKEDYFSAPDEIRARGLTEALSNPEIDAVLFARGGYGLQRIMPTIDFSHFKKHPKPIVGFSDLTPLLGFVSSHLRVPTFYGPVVTMLAEKCLETEERLFRALTTNDALGKVPSENAIVIQDGEAKGPLIGGCLSLIQTSIGTPYSLKTENSILLIEDHDEPVYAYDRMLTHLKNAGLFDKVKGIVFGSMKLAGKNETNEQLFKMIAKVLGDFKGPVVAGLPIGHQAPFVTVPLGVESSLIARNNAVNLEFLEPALI